MDHEQTRSTLKTVIKIDSQIFPKICRAVCGGRFSSYEKLVLWPFCKASSIPPTLPSIFPSTVSISVMGVWGRVLWLDCGDLLYGLADHRGRHRHPPSISSRHSFEFPEASLIKGLDFRLCLVNRRTSCYCSSRPFVDCFCFSFRKPLPKIDSSTLGVNELDLKIQETRIMEKVCKVY